MANMVKNRKAEMTEIKIKEVYYISRPSLPSLPSLRLGHYPNFFPIPPY
jgi:hypothetical protein